MILNQSTMGSMLTMSKCCMYQYDEGYKVSYGLFRGLNPYYRNRKTEFQSRSIQCLSKILEK